MDECSVCLNPVRCTRTTKRLPCNHLFHGTCISDWLLTHNNCPNCRTEVKRPKFKVTINIENTRTNQTTVISPDTEFIIDALFERLGLDRQNFFSTEVSFDAFSLSELHEIISEFGFGNIDIDTAILNTE